MSANTDEMPQLQFPLVVSAEIAFGRVWVVMLCCVMLSLEKGEGVQISPPAVLQSYFHTLGRLMLILVLQEIQI